MCPFPRSWWTYPDGPGSRCEPLPAPRPGAGLRVGLFGNLGSGISATTPCKEAMLKYIAVCGDPQTAKGRYGVPAIALR